MQTSPGAPEKWQSQDIGTMLNDAVAHHQSGRLAEAERLYRQILAADANHADALHLLGVIAHQVGDNAAAAELIGRAIQINGGVSMYHNNLGNALLALGKTGEAMTAYERALELNPEYAEAHMNVGNILKDMNKSGEAVLRYERTIRINPDYALAHMNLGNVLLDLGKFDEAIASLKRAAALLPSYPQAHYNLGVALAAQDNTAGATACFEQAIILKPDYAEAFMNLGGLLKHQGKLEEAAKAYRRAIALKPDYAEVHNNLGNVLFDQGDAAGSIASYEQALAIKPDFAEPHLNLGNISFHQGKFEEAAGSYERGIAIRPGYVEARYNLMLTKFLMTPVREWDKLCGEFLALDNLPLKHKHGIYVRLAIRNWIVGDCASLVDALNSCVIASDALGPSSEKNVVSMRAYEKLLRGAYEYHAERGFSLLQLKADEEIALLGDSNCLSPAHTNLKIGGTAHKAVPHLIVGCKAWHLSRKEINPYKRSFDDAIERIRPGTKCIVMFGEIDCRHDEGIIGHYMKHGGEIEDIATRFVPDYVRNVAEAMRERKLQVSFANVPAPNTKILYENHKDFTPEEEKRLIEVIRLFNNELRGAAAECGCGYIDTYGFTAGPDGKADGSRHIDGYHLLPGVLALALETNR